MHSWPLVLVWPTFGLLDRSLTNNAVIICDAFLISAHHFFKKWVEIIPSSAKTLQMVIRQYMFLMLIDVAFKIRAWWHLEHISILSVHSFGLNMDLCQDNTLSDCR